MIVEKEEAFSDLNNKKSICNLKILHQFIVKDSCLAVVSLEELAEIQKKLPSNNGDANHSFPTLGWFEFEGDRYAIVKNQHSAENNDLDLTQVLTERELQIATLVASGCSNKQVANQLRISEWTVSAHLRRIFIKLNVDSRAAMVYRCASLIQKLCQR